MKEKLLQFFTGKMSKTIYISIAAAVVCGAVVITSTVIVHNNNQKIDSVLESLSASESVAELSSESVIESVSDADNTESGAQAKSPNGEPAGDKALQYLAEYDKLTEEYERKRAELIKQKDSVPYNLATDKFREAPKYSSDLDTWDKREEFMSEVLKWEDESRAYDKSVSIAVSKAKEEQANEQSEIQKQIDALDAQYEKDVAALKARYGIA